MKVTWNLDQYLSCAREKRQRQKKSWWRHCRKLWRHCHFSIYGQFGAIRNKPYIFMNSNLLCCNKLKSKLKNIQHSSHTIALSKGTIFPQNADCLQKEILTSAKLRRSWYWKFSETTYVFLRTYLGLKF